MMPSGVFESYERNMEPLRAERMLDAATAATAQFQKTDWWEGLLARARGAAAEVARRAAPLFTWNGAPVNSSQGLRRKFAEGVTGGRVES